MNLLCPNCQKMLTVPEEFAGQLMKCPLCGGTFTVPGLPGAAAPPPPESDIFSIRHEPAPPPPPPPAPNFELTSSPPPAATTTKPPAGPPSLPPPPPEGYQHIAAVWLSPRVLPWIAPICLLLVFVLQFFNWVGLYPGGVPAGAQNAWQAAFGTLTLYGDMKPSVPVLDDDKYKPGVSALTLFYLLLFFPVLAVTVASIAISMVPLRLPPAVEQLLPWRWGIVAAANLILFLFLALQLLLGFSMDSRYSEWVDKQVDSKGTKTTQQQKMVESERGVKMDVLHHTVWLRLVVLLHLLAIFCSLLMFWVNQRGTHRPLPKLELLW